MSEAEDRRELANRIATSLTELVQVDPDSLARAGELSPQINFTDSIEPFRRMLNLLRELNDRDLTRLPKKQLEAIGKAAETVHGLVKKVKEFQIDTVERPGDVCKEIIKEVDSAYDGIANQLLLPLAFTATQATDYARIEREAKGYHATMQQQAKDIEEYLNQVKDDAGRALEAVKEQAAEAGVSTNAHIFSANAEQHRKAALYWLYVTTGMSVLTLVATLAALVNAFYPSFQTLEGAVQYAIAKILVISTLSFITVWCARNYKAEKHNETLSRHRANALMTFRAFVEGTQDPHVRDAILLHAAQAAFAPRPSGYDGPDKDGQALYAPPALITRLSQHSDG